MWKLKGTIEMPLPACEFDCKVETDTRWPETGKIKNIPIKPPIYRGKQGQAEA